MNETPGPRQSVAVERIKRHQFITMIIGSIVISLFLVYVALSLYQSSGTLQLDLSRPGYEAARQEAVRDKEFFEGFSADGPIDQESLTEFEELYKEKSDEAAKIDAYGGEALSDHALRLDR